MTPLTRLGALRKPRRIGAKAARLQFLLRHRFAVPPCWVCGWDLYERYLAGDSSFLPGLRHALERTLKPGRSYAVRSSANVEDHSEHSFAGQFRSVLGAQGVVATLAAIESVWESARQPALSAYLEHHGQDQNDLRMAVIIQEMVSAQASGVAFSRNPLTGLDEVLIEAVAGSGERLVQEGVTPQRWVWKWGAWVERPSAAMLAPDVAEAVARGARQIARVYRHPVDLEWVYDGEQLWWVQVRDITGLSNLDVYSNHISGEFLPGLIKPLVWSINVPLVNGAWIRLLTEIIGPNDLAVERLAHSFYYRAYFNMGPFGDIFERLGMPREGLELLMGLELGGSERPSLRPGPRVLLALPRLLGFAAGKRRYARRVRADLAATASDGPEAFRHLDAKELAELAEQDLIERVDDLYPRAQRLAYHNILVPLLERMLVRLLHRALQRRGIAPDQLDLSGSLPEVAALNPTAQLDRLQGIYHELPLEVQKQVADFGYAWLRSFSGAEPLTNALDGFLAGFGHLSDSGNDFSATPWRENPDLVLKMVISHQPRTTTATPWERLPLSAWQRWQLSGLFRLVSRYRVLREQVSSRYTFAYGLFRELFVALGSRLAVRGLITSPEDIFYLTLPEIHALVAGEDVALAESAQTRQREMSAMQRITPPRVIYGAEPPPLVQTAGERLRGTPTSRGRHTGPVRQARGLTDLPRIAREDVLVVPYSDVGWTPLFARAGAVVAESGGMLSHSSIVAREYGLPAVVSVNGALAIPEGTVVTVDGYSGEIVVHHLAEEVES